MRKLAIVLSFVAAVALLQRVQAHEGHAHKIMGTATVVDATHLEVETTDANKVSQKVSLTLDQLTKYKKGTALGAAADLKVGARVVITYEEEGGKKIAREVMLGGSEKAAEMPEHKH